MPLSQDRPYWPDFEDKTPEGAQYIFDDKFEEGLGPWRGHLGGTTRHCPISLTSLRTWPGSPHAMLLSCSTRPIVGGDCQAYRNFSRDIDEGKMRLEVWMMLGQPQTSSDDDVNTISSLFIAMDSQAWDDTHRGLPKLRWRVRSTPDAGSTIINAWSIPADNGDTVYIAEDGSGHPNEVPAVQPPSPGENEFKLNYFRVALWYDLSTIVSTDGMPGRYFRAEIGPKVYDLTGFVDSNGDPVGRCATAPQVASTVGGGSFRGGHNVGIGLINRLAVTLNYPPILIVPRVRATWFPKDVLV